MKKVLISLIILFLIAGSFSIYYLTSIRNNKEEKTVLDTTNNNPDDNLSDKEEKNNEPITEINKNDTSNDNNNTNNDVSSNKNNMESNNTANTNVIDQNSNKSNVEQEKPKEEIKIEPKPEPKVEQHQPTAWESLGISEYDYYNKPMWSWARIDYSVKTYGNFEQTHQACIDAGNSMEDIVSFSCTNINSYSGDYLGDMLRVKY